MGHEMDRNFLIVAGLCLTSLMVRTGYELLKRAGKVETNNKLVFAVVFAAMILMLLSWPAFFLFSVHGRMAFSGARVAGLAMAIPGLLLALAGLFQLRGVENIDNLVTTGLYSRIRHPMYIGFILWILGWGIASGAIVSFALGLAAVANIILWRHWEETDLQARYGQVYVVYRRQTWF
jgi:protein-S-isoprenylcysteine O-methyltransferase Ste14